MGLRACWGLEIELRVWGCGLAVQVSGCAVWDVGHVV